MSTDTLLHILEIFIIGAPLWWGVIRLVSIMRDFPPHLHDNGNIIYPKGYEPGKRVALYRTENK
jgi:hypothetical protein